MQQTNQYQFHLIEAADNFSPVPLNENTQKVETLLTALKSETEQSASNLRADFQAAITSLAQKDTALENTLSSLGNAKVAYGTYIGTGAYGSGSPNALTFSFKPLFVVVLRGGLTMFAIQGSDGANGLQGSRDASGYDTSTYAWKNVCSWSGNGLSWYNASDSLSQFNSSDMTYYYVAMG